MYLLVLGFLAFLFSTHAQHNKLSLIKPIQRSSITPWHTNKMPISPPPPLTNKQMGTINTLGIPPLGYTQEADGTKVFTLIAQPITQMIIDKKTAEPLVLPHLKIHPQQGHKHATSKKLKTWGYNGTTPGPTIEVTEGDRVKIIVKNELPEPTTVHWHSLEIPYAQDGSSDPIKPGDTKTYSFTVNQNGTFLYHSGYNVGKQLSSGLVGFFVAHPKKTDIKPNHDIAIMMQEWALLPENSYPNLTSMDFNWFTFNGHAAPSVPVVNIKQGDRVRIRFSNMSMNSHPIHIHGYVWNVIGTEGGPIPKSAQVKGSTINVPTGTTRDVEFIAWNPGPWPLHCHKPHHVMNAHAQVPLGIMPHGGMFTILNVVPHNKDVSWKHYKESSPKNNQINALGYKKKLPHKNQSQEQSS